jgi:HlyD family secretion protein
MSAINNLKGKKTIIIVAHRLKTIHKCDEIFYIENGKLFDSGTYDYLINNNEKFKNLSKNA